MHFEKVLGKKTQIVIFRFTSPQMFTRVFVSRFTHISKAFHIFLEIASFSIRPVFDENAQDIWNPLNDIVLKPLIISICLTIGKTFQQTNSFEFGVVRMRTLFSSSTQQNSTVKQISSHFAEH